MPQYRQGDVWITPVAKLPTSLAAVPRDDRGRIVLALGEATGHAHAIASRDAVLLVDPATGRRYLVVTDGSIIADPEVTLDHEEHATVALAPGAYEVRIQRQYSPAGIQRVAD